MIIFMWELHRAHASRHFKVMYFIEGQGERLRAELQRALRGKGHALRRSGQMPLGNRPCPEGGGRLGSSSIGTPQALVATART